MHDHEHDHDHDGHGSMPVYQFLGNILGYPLDETLLFNVSDPAFWAGLRESLENERTHDALDHIEAAVAKLADIPEDHRKMAMDAEYARAFLLPEAPMPPLESAYGLDGGAVYDVARELGVETSIQRFLPDDHIANELFMLVPLDYLQQPSDEQLGRLRPSSSGIRLRCCGTCSITSKLRRMIPGSTAPSSSLPPHGCNGTSMRSKGIRQTV